MIWYNLFFIYCPSIYIILLLAQFRNGEKSRAEDEAEHKSTNNSSTSTENKQVRTTKFKESREKPDIANATNLSSPKTLKRSNREASTRPDKTIISNTADHVSKFCRLSNYSDFLRAPFSTLKKSIATKNRNNTVANETKKNEIVKVNENHEANVIDYLNSGEYSIQYLDKLMLEILKHKQHFCKNVFHNLINRSIDTTK